jgi:hypothetical protein
LKGSALSRAKNQMHVGTDVGKSIDSDPEAPRHVAQSFAHDTCVPTKRERAVCPLARQDDMHRAAGANRTFEFAPSAPNGTPVFRPHELGMHLAGEKRPLH